MGMGGGADELMGEAQKFSSEAHRELILDPNVQKPQKLSLDRTLALRTPLLTHSLAGSPSR